jgi:hypothetical protein
MYPFYIDNLRSKLFQPIVIANGIALGRLANLKETCEVK